MVKPLTLDEFVLDHIRRHAGATITIRKLWRFVTSDIYRCVVRLWWHGKVHISRTLEVTARDEAHVVQVSNQ